MIRKGLLRYTRSEVSPEMLPMKKRRIEEIYEQTDFWKQKRL